MSEHRRQPRRFAADVVQAYDANEGSTLGTLVNITTQGLMLVGQVPIADRSVYQIDMLFPLPNGEHEKLSFGAESLWCSRATEEHYWTGFQIIDISEESTKSILELTEDWATAPEEVAH